MSKKLISRFAVIAAVAAVSQGAFAAAGDSGQVNFEGSITSSICSIGPTSANQTVKLGVVTVNKFKAAGDRSLPQDFSIDLHDCPAVAADKPANVATVTFKGDTAPGGKLLKIANGEVGSGAAKNLAIQIMDSTGKQIDVGSPSGDYTLGEGTNRLKFKASYIATATGVTAGSANASSTFQIDYK